MRKIYSSIVVAFFFLVICCTKDDVDPASGPITIEFDNVVGTSNLQLNTLNTPYTNAKGEPYKISRLVYYVSSIQLRKSDGTFYADPVSPDGSAGYYLIDESKGESQQVTLNNVPAGDYTEVVFTIGGDAGQVSQGAQTGAHDPANGFFWSWNSGYIFLAIEGVSPASTEPGSLFEYHVGGYKEDAVANQVNNVRTISLHFLGESVPVRAQHEPEVHVLFDVGKFFNGIGEQVSFADNAARHSPKACKELSDNLPGSFIVDHVHAN
jgi:hypothetical protein